MSDSLAYWYWLQAAISTRQLPSPCRCVS